MTLYRVTSYRDYCTMAPLHVKICSWRRPLLCSVIILLGNVILIAELISKLSRRHLTSTTSDDLATFTAIRLSVDASVQQQEQSDRFKARLGRAVHAIACLNSSLHSCLHSWRPLFRVASTEGLMYLSPLLNI